MDLAPYVDNLRRELALAAATGGEEARALGERLTAPLEAAARLALLEALSAAADEITRDLAPGSVDVRLRGRDPEFVVRSPQAEAPFEGASAATAPTAPVPPVTDEGGTTRVALRVPDVLKPRIDEAAAREGLSVNAWLVRAVSAALDRSAAPVGERRDQNARGRYSGWVR